MGIAVATALMTVACEGDGGVGLTATPGTTTSPIATAEAVPPIAPSATLALAADPCTLRTSLEGRPLTAGPSFELGNVVWQMCIGGAAAGSSEKLLFKTSDGGASWTLLSQTTLGNPPPEPGVGELPNGNAAEALFFVDEQHGWLGLSSPGQNLFRTDDSGVTWSEVPVWPPGLPVLDVSFSDARHGELTTPEGSWTTSDGGETWTQTP